MITKFIQLFITQFLKIVVPFYKHKVSTDQKFEREKLISEIKASRFRLKFGPFWLRKLVEKFLNFFQKNKFVFLILFKSMMSIVFILMPISAFLLIRGVLPVPERVPYEEPDIKLENISKFKIDFPYTPSVSEQSKKFRDFSIGYFPLKLEILKSLNLAEDSPLVLTKSGLGYTDSKNLESKLRIGYYLNPSEDGKLYGCMLQVFNSNNELLAQSSEVTPKIDSYSKYSIKNSWRRAFTPNIIPSYGSTSEFIIPIDTLPETLVLRAVPISQSPQFTQSSYCHFSVFDFSVTYQLKQKLPRRGVIFIAVDGLRASTANNPKIMPTLNAFVKNNSVIFDEHRTTTNDSNESFRSLLTSRYPTELISNTVTENMLSSIQNLGYRVGAIGAISAVTHSIPNGIDLNLPDVIVTEQARYNGRYVTEFAGQWLKKYGETPFFLYLHYNTISPPYKPPFEYLDLTKLILHPFGWKQKKQLYLGVSRYFDSEFELLLQKIHDFGILNNVDIIITSHHGASLNQLESEFADDFIHVPFIVKLSRNKKRESIHIQNFSSHLDVFPSVYTFMGGSSRSLNVRGNDISKLFEEFKK